MERPDREEIHAIRAQIADECNDDLQKIVARLRQKEQKHADRLVRKEDIVRPSMAASPK